jgi:orotidine-5'-phosphate decarboxylase
MSICEKYERRVTEVNSLVCVGLDSQIERLPARFLTREHPQFDFNQWIIQQTHPFVSAYKPNMAFYEARGAAGWRELALTMQYLREQHPEILTICDAKRADIGSTNEGYVTAIFDDLGFDAVTLHPYLGQEALNPFLDREDKACIILCRTSNPGAGELQDLRVEGKLLWQTVAEKVSQDWNTNNNCMLVVGATYPDEMRQIRQIVGEMTFLVPGIGAQGGEVEKTVRAGLNRARRGMIVNSSRGLIFADNPGEAAKRLRDDINRHRG